MVIGLDMKRFHGFLRPARRHGVMAAALLFLLVFSAGTAAIVRAAVVPITPANVGRIDQTLSAGQIAVYVTRGGGGLGSNPQNSTARYTFVPGPGTPPLGFGSLHMPTGIGTGSGNGGRVWASSTDLNGTLLSAVSTLSYASYVTTGGVTAPALNLYVDLNGNGAWNFASDALLVYEPYWNGTVSQNIWQSWNAATGRWWDSRGKVASNAGGGVCNRTFAQILDGSNPPGCTTIYAAYPNARVVAASGSLPGLHVVTGDSNGTSTWANFNGFIDAFNTGVNTYDFEAPTTVYIDPAWSTTPALQSVGSIFSPAAIRYPFGTAPFVASSNCPLTPRFYGLDGFASQADMTAVLGAAFTGTVLTCADVAPTAAPTATNLPTETPVPTATDLPTETLLPTNTTVPGETATETPLPTETGTVTETPVATSTSEATGTATAPIPRPTLAAPTVQAVTAPLCSLIGGGTNTVVRASVTDGTVTRGSVFCQVITENSQFVRDASEIGVLSVIQQGPLQAVEVFGLLHTGDSAPDFNNPITVCLAGSGRIIYLSALQAPRTPAQMTTLATPGYTCALIPDAGTVVLIP
jgi:hypothetical protein